MKILDLDAKERPTVIGFITLIIVRSSGKAMGLAAVQTILVKRWGLENLGGSYILLAIMGMIGALIYLFFADIGRRTTLFKTYSLITGLMMIAAVFFIPAGSLSDLAEGELPWEVFIFSVMVFAAYTLGDSTLGIQVWTMIGDTFRHSQGIRIYPIIATAHLLGGIIGGFFLQILSQYIPSEGMILFWGLTILSGYFFIGKLERTTLSLRYSPPSAAKSWLPHFWQGCKFSFRSPLVYGIAGVCILFWTVASLKEFQYNRLLNIEFSTEESLNIYYGYYTILLNTSVLAIQWKITSNIIRKVGVAYCFCLLPITILSGLSFIAIFDFWVMAILMRYTFDIVAMTVQGSAFQLSFNAIPSSYRGRVRGLLEGIINPIGGVIGGIILTFLAQNTAKTNLANHPFGEITVLGIFFCLIWLSLAMIIPSQYRKQLFQNLRSDDSRTRQDAWEMLQEIKEKKMPENKATNSEQTRLPFDINSFCKYIIPLSKPEDSQIMPIKATIQIIASKNYASEAPTWVKSNEQGLVLRKNFWNETKLSLLIRYGRGCQQLILTMDQIHWHTKCRNTRLITKRQDCRETKLITTPLGILYWKSDFGYLASFWENGQLESIEIGHFAQEYVETIFCTEHDFNGPYKLRIHESIVNPFSRFLLEIQPLGFPLE